MTKTPETPQELMAQLSSASARLPNKTLFQLALAGLRVRLMRSLITLLSVVLAIAYLSYSGASNELIRNLALKSKMAQPDSEEIYSLLRTARINVEVTAAGNPLDRWLAIMALLTCTVGIANAMLMSVTERFREIGTMKCLGAENATVVKLFLIESSLLGVVGSVAGIVIGILLSAVIGLIQFKWYALIYMPFGMALLYGLYSFIAGVILCLVGAGYPALVAARMRPVEALRVEE
jgi:ABC-type antimicrobial peptide transport system permease subunit